MMVNNNFYRGVFVGKSPRVLILSRSRSDNKILLTNHGILMLSDDGLVIPTVTRELRGRVSAACARVGLGGSELLGRAGAEVALQLLGGGRRLHPCNTHQVPTVAFLIGPHR